MGLQFAMLRILTAPYNMEEILTKKMDTIDLSCISVNKGTNSRLGWTKYSDLYEIVHPSLVLISLCLLTGAECGKGLIKTAQGNNRFTTENR